MLLLSFKIFLALLFVTAVSLFTGCADDLTAPAGTVNVHLTDMNGFDFYQRSAFTNASIGYYPVMLPDAKGNCRFTSSGFPYEIAVQNSGERCTFKGVSAYNPVITLQNKYPDVTTNEKGCDINIYFPQNDNDIGLLKFISDEPFSQDTALVKHLGSGNYRTTVIIPKLKNSIKGKLIYIICSAYIYYGYLHIYSYKKLGVKDVELFPGTVNVVSFSENELSSIPVTADYYYTIHVPDPGVFANVKVFLTFPGYNLNSNIKIYEEYYATYGYIRIPLNIMPSQNVKIESSYRGNSYFAAYDPFKSSISGPDTSVVITHNKIEIISPPAEQTNINENTVFSFSDELPAGIYAIDLLEGNNNGGSMWGTVYTDKRSITFGELKGRLFAPKPNTHYLWSVSKLTNFANMNDFLSSQFNIRENFSEILTSKSRGFTTAP